MSAPPELELRRGRPARVELVRAVDGLAPRWATTVSLVDDGERLCVDFDCADPDPWATSTARDGRLWEEEVVELFAAPGRETPLRYVEIEVNPLGTVFDATVTSPRGDRTGLTVDAAWTCPGLETRAAADPAAARWRVSLAVPWRALALGAEPPPVWRVNLYRIDRPRTGATSGVVEFSAWSPTLVAPADFHRPARFGILTRRDSES